MHIQSTIYYDLVSKRKLIGYYNTKKKNSEVYIFDQYLHLLYTKLISWIIQANIEIFF